MAFGRLINEKIVIDTNNALNYKSKEGEIQQRKVDTALIDVIKEAGQVASMEHGSVLFSAKVNGDWKNYFVNRDEKTHNIVLKPTNSQNRDDFIYINSNVNEQGYFYYTINQKRESAKELIEGVGITEHQNQDGTKSHYLETNVRLYNEELKQELKEKGNEFIAVISNTGIKVVNEAEMKAQKQEQQMKQTKEINVAFVNNKNMAVEFSEDDKITKEVAQVAAMQFNKLYGTETQQAHINEKNGEFGVVVVTDGKETELSKGLIIKNATLFALEKAPEKINLKKSSLER